MDIISFLELINIYVIENYLNLVKEEINITDKKAEPFVKQLNYHLDILSKFTDWMKEKIKNSPEDASGACNDYLKVLGIVATGHAWLKVLEVSFKEYDNNSFREVLPALPVIEIILALETFLIL